MKWTNANFKKPLQDGEYLLTDDESIFEGYYREGQFLVLGEIIPVTKWMPLPEEEINTAKTSRNQIPSGLKYLAESGMISEGEVNFDIGAGKYNKGTEYLNSLGIINLTYDPVALPFDHNKDSVERLQGKKAKTATILNVLNVIPTKKDRRLLIEEALHRFSNTLVIQVYEKNKDGIVELTRDGWQLNQPLQFYRTEILDWFPEFDVSVVKGQFIIVRRKD